MRSLSSATWTSGDPVSPWCCWNFEIVSALRTVETGIGYSSRRRPRPGWKRVPRSSADWGKGGRASSAEGARTAPDQLGKHAVVDRAPGLGTRHRQEPAVLVKHLELFGFSVP